MDALNDETSDIYNKTLDAQKTYITKRLQTIKNRYIDNSCGLCDTKENIANHLNLGPAQNLIQTFFKYTTDTCMVCHKTKEEVRQFERAHCNKFSRYDLLLQAVTNIYIDEKTPIKSGDTLKEFIKCHDVCPIYILCSGCHSEYDNNPMYSYSNLSRTPSLSIAKGYA